MDADSGDLNCHSNNNNNASTLFSFPLQPTAHKGLLLNPSIHVHPQQHPHLNNLQEMLETSTALDHSHHIQFDNRNTSMYYPSQPSSAYGEGSPESLRKTSPVNFIRNVPPSKRIIDLETRALHGVDAPGVFDTSKNDYYGNAESYGVNFSAGQFLRSPQSEYYPMETAFSMTPSHPPQMTGMGFPKEDETQGELSGDSGRGYDYTSPHSNPQLRHPPPLMPPMRTEPTYLEESFGKVDVISHTTILPQHHTPSSTSSTNSGTNNGGKGATNRLQSGGSAGSTAIIYPWMKRVHSKGKFQL